MIDDLARARAWKSECSAALLESAFPAVLYVALRAADDFEAAEILDAFANQYDEWILAGVALATTEQENRR